MTREQPLHKVLSDFASVMRQWGRRWYLFGAQAVVFWGQVRNTEDIDVTAEVDIDEAPELVEAMKAAGFEPRIVEWHQLARESRTLLFTHVQADAPLDVVLAGPGLEEDFLDRAVERDLLDYKLPVISAEDLVASKIVAGRAKDLEDAYSILRKQEDHLNLDRVRSTLSWLQTMLRREDLEPALDDLLDRVRQRTP